jgi:hypothetical protein
MVAALGDRVLDLGLNALKSETTTISIVSAEPTTIAIASTQATNQMLGYKSFTAGSIFAAAISAGTPNGRMVTSVAVSDGTVVTNGTASWWAVWLAGTLHAHGTLSSAQGVTAGNSFTLTAFSVTIPASA